MIVVSSSVITAGPAIHVPGVISERRTSDDSTTAAVAGSNKARRIWVVISGKRDMTSTGVTDCAGVVALTDQTVISTSIASTTRPNRAAYSRSNSAWKVARSGVSAWVAVNCTGISQPWPE